MNGYHILFYKSILFNSIFIRINRIKTNLFIILF